MAINLTNPEVESALRALAEEAGESLTEAAGIAILERLERVRGSKRRRQSLQVILELIKEGQAATPRIEVPLKPLSDELWGDE